MHRVGNAGDVKPIASTYLVLSTKGGLMEKISQNTYVQIGTRGCNHSFVATTEGPVMIDTPMMPEDAQKWKTELVKFGTLKYIINGEPHVDHISGNFFFEAPIIAHEGARKAILESPVEQYAGMLKQNDPKMSLPAGYYFRPPVITLSERMTLYVGAHTFQLMHLPGHTPFQVAVYVPEEKVVFTSDNVTYNVPPFMQQALPYDWIESLKKLKKLDIEKVVPGHGNVCGPEQLDVMIEIIQGAIDVVKSAIKAGMTAEEAQKNVNLFKQFPKNERTTMIQGIGIPRLYEVLKVK
jgi:cyclase